jgi:hypothetical protein
MHPRDLLDKRLRRQFVGDAHASVLAQPMSDDEWASVSAGEARRIADDPGALANVLARITVGRRTYVLPRQRTPRDSPSPREATGRGTVVATLLASWMLEAHDPYGVIEFRRAALHDRLPEPQGIARWVARQLRASRGSMTGKSLAYRVPSSEWVRHVATRAGHPLETLRQASERVAAFTGWAAADATVFILTGITPHMVPIRAEIHYQPAASVRSRIVLTIDPTSTPADVATAYRRLRAGNFGRVRRLSKKHTTLAQHALAHPDASPQEQMARWNRRYRRKWPYRQLNAFARDVQQALHRLAHPVRPPRLP